jgi:alpha-L-arabinofuranosidase
VIIKAVNYKGVSNTLLVRLQGSSVSAGTTVKTYTLRAGLDDAPSLEHPDAIKPVEKIVSFAKDMSFKMEPYSVLMIEVTPR